MAEKTPPEESGHQDQESTTELPEELDIAIEVVQGSPDDDEAWDQLEDAAAAAQMPDEVARLYSEVLASDLSAERVGTLGQRAANFLEEWFGEESETLVQVLTRVLEVDLKADWAFHKLTVAHTVAARWDELLALYDKVIEAAEDSQQKQSLLDEAINVAKDFAGAPDRAIEYLQQLRPLRPEDGQLISSLERLLERGHRWRELVELWRSRLDRLEPAEAIEMRYQIASYLLHKLDDPDPAIDQLELVLHEETGEEGRAVELLEQIASREEAAADVRRRALELLKARYENSENPKEVVRVLKAAMSLASENEAASLHREVGERLIANESFDEAMGHFSELLRLEPTAVDAHQRLRELAGRTGNSEGFAKALEVAADASDLLDGKASLRLEAAEIRKTLGDQEGATRLYQNILREEKANAAAILEACRQLNGLLEATGQAEEQLEVLERLAEHEPEPKERRVVLGRAARLSESTGQIERALRIWKKRIDENSDDIEALNETINILQRQQTWELLVEMLMIRSQTSVPARQSRDDLVYVAKLKAEKLDDTYGAIETWQEVREKFGDEDESTHSLADLYAQTSRWKEYASLLDGAAERDSLRVSNVLARLGEVCRDQLSEPDKALTFFQRALRVNPEQQEALTGLRRMVDEDAERRPLVCAALAQAYETIEAWAQLLDIFEVRLEVLETPAAKARLLRETAIIQEKHLNNATDALRSYCRALMLTPWDDTLELDITRLGKETGEWDSVVDAYNEAAEAAQHETRQLHLWFEAGRLADEYLHDPEISLDAYGAVHSKTPGKIEACLATIRAAGNAHQWERLAESAIAYCLAHQELSEPIVKAVQESAEEADAWDELINALEVVVVGLSEPPPQLGRKLDHLIAQWHEKHRDDAKAAEKALCRAAAQEGEDEEVLGELIRLQRGSESRDLYESLVRLVEVKLKYHDIDLLDEAAKLALEHLDEWQVKKESLQRLYREGARLWRQGIPATGEGNAEGLTRWALDELVKLHLETGDYEQAISLLTEGSQLPVIAAASIEMRRQAAEIASEQLKDNKRAIILYRSLLSDAPEDSESIHEFARICKEEGLNLELLSLLKRELTLCGEPETKLALRLDIARLIGTFENLGGRLDMLKVNLEEHPGHKATIDSLIKFHEDAGLHQELADVLTEQATLLEGRNKTERAAELWRKIASLAEENLSDKERAIHCYQRVQKLIGSVASLDSLARLQLERGEHAAAARWLERRLNVTEGDERLTIFKRLAQAYLAAKQTDLAIKHLENCLDESPSAMKVRTTLAELYRARRQLEPLARLLTEAAPHIDDLETLRSYASEAAQLYSQLGSPDRAITVLEKASSLAPEDRGLKRMLAEGLIASERVDEGQSILEDLINDFGRRRNPERARVHYLLAKALKRQGNLEIALEQLELASKMDVSNTSIAAMLGQLSVEAGELDRAERTYRALLMVVRRQPPEGEDALGPAEVLYELYRLAKERGREDQSQELSRSMLQTASQSESEARRFRKAMQKRFEPKLLLEALEMRVQAAPQGPELAVALNNLAKLLSSLEDRRDEALDAYFKALEQAPDAWDIHHNASSLAHEMKASARYVEQLRELIKTVRREDETDIASQLLQRLGRTLEEDLEDFEGAAQAFLRVEALGHHVVEARMALARVAGAQGNRVEEIRLLKALVADESLAENARSDSRYRLAELQLHSVETAPEGLMTLENALDKDAYYEKAGEILRFATSEPPMASESMVLYGKVARASGEEPLLLDYLEKRALSPDASLDEVREAVEILGQQDGADDRLETLLRRAVKLAEASEKGLSGALWAPLGLSQMRKLAGDLKEAAEWLARAADSSPDSEEAFDLWLSAASIAAKGGDYEQAVTVFERLMDRDPSNPKIWEPALESARALGNEERLVKLVNSTLSSLMEPEDRTAVRLQHALFLQKQEGREPEAADVLQEVLRDQPGHQEATQILTTLYEQIGYDEDLSGLIQQQLDAAKDGENLDSIRELSLKLGKLLATIRREDAMDVYRQALDWLPDDREIASSLLDLLGEDNDPRERVELMERPLKIEKGEAAARLALTLADEWLSLEDAAGVERVLRQGYDTCPEHEQLRERLESWFSERSDWRSLTELILKEADRLDEPSASVALLQKAADIFSDSLEDHNGAINCLAKARSYAPDDFDLLGTLVRIRTVNNDIQTATQEVTENLERVDQQHPSRVALLQLRADLYRVAGEESAVVTDLEEAYSLAGQSMAQLLVESLEHLRISANVKGDLEAERQATLRLVVVHLETNDRPPARAVLGAWLSERPEDREALYQLLELDEYDEQWQAVAMTCEQLVGLEEGETQVEIVLRMTEAYNKIEQPERARAGLERVYQNQPQIDAIRQRLWDLYEKLGATQELATMLVAQALGNEDLDEKFLQLQKAASLFIDSGEGGRERAIVPLEEANQLNPDDHTTAILLIDSYISTGQYAEAGKLLEQAIAERGSRRTPQLAELQHRMAHLAAIAGDKQLQLQWLNVAFDSDRRNGFIVAELAPLAMELGELDLAMSALRVITVSKVESSLTKAQAFLAQAKIAHEKGESRRAMMWAHRAHEEDPELTEAADFLEQVGGG